MAVRTGHVQRARAVEREVGAAEQRGVRLVGVILQRVGCAIGQGVLRAVGQRDEALVRLLHVDRGTVLVVDGRSREHHLDLHVFGHLDDELPVIERAGDDVHALLRDRHGGAVGRRAVSLDARGRPVKRDVRGGGVVVTRILIAVAVFQIKRRHVEGSRNFLEGGRRSRVGQRVGRDRPRRAGIAVARRDPATCQSRHQRNGKRRPKSLRDEGSGSLRQPNYAAKR